MPKTGTLVALTNAELIGYSIKADVIDESTLDTGVTIEGVKFENGGIVTDLGLQAKITPSGGYRLLTSDAAGTAGVVVDSPSLKTDAGGNLKVESSSDDSYGAKLTLSDSQTQVTGGGGKVAFSGSYTGTTVVDAGLIGAYKENSTDGQDGFNMRFYTRENGVGSLEERMVLNENGAGFGGITPLARFHVDAPALNGDDLLRLSEGGTTLASFNSAGKGIFPNQIDMVGSALFLNGANQYIDSISDNLYLYNTVSGKAVYYKVTTAALGVLNGIRMTAGASPRLDTELGTFAIKQYAGQSDNMLELNDSGGTLASFDSSGGLYFADGYTGLYQPSSGTMRVKVGNTDRFQYVGQSFYGITTNAAGIRNIATSDTVPGLLIRGNISTTGIGGNSGEVSLITGSVEAVRIDANRVVETFSGRKEYFQNRTTDVTLLTNSRIMICDATSGTFTITLPIAANSSKVVYEIKHDSSAANTVIVEGNASELIEEDLNIHLAPGESIKIICDGSKWHIL